MKKVLSIVIVIIMLFSVAVSANTTVLQKNTDNNMRLGDVNKDDIVDATDALHILEMAAGLRGKTDIYSPLASLNPTTAPTPVPTCDWNDVVDYKPVIYLYPEVETQVSVKLDYNGTLTSKYPTYNDGWNVVAQPDGKLYDKETDKEYYCLFWEGVQDFAYDFSEGFVVAGSDTKTFLESALRDLGLTDKEANEFIIFWLPKMEKNKYNLISFQKEAYTENAKLNISPEPDSVLRVFMAYKELDEPIHIKPQTLTGFERKGFTVVEWGGSDCSDCVVLNNDNTVTALKLGDVNKDGIVSAADALYVLQIAADLKEDVLLYPTKSPVTEETDVPTILPTIEPTATDIITPIPTLEPWLDDTACPEKPVIYLYPESEMEVTVDLEFNGEITSVYPDLNDGWKVIAKPDGTLYDEKTDREYYCLFWEGEANHSYDFSEGFVVAGSDVKEFLEWALGELGLNYKEANEFIIYWLPQMETNAYNLISFQDEVYTDNAKLSINPEPDSVLRVFMAYKALNEPVEIKKQELKGFTREGFTIVEWGGADCTE